MTMWCVRRLSIWNRGCAMTIQDCTHIHTYMTTVHPPSQNDYTLYTHTHTPSLLECSPHDEGSDRQYVGPTLQ